MATQDTTVEDTTVEDTAVEDTAVENMTGTQVMREFLPNSPFVGHVGIELVDLDDGRPSSPCPSARRWSRSGGSSTGARSRR